MHTAHHAHEKSTRITRNVIALGFVSLFTDAATEMIYPLVPVFVSLLGSGVLVLGVIEGVAESTAAMLKLASGVISDKTGKRKLLVVIGYGISTLVRPLTGLVSAAWQIVIVRMMDRTGKGIRTAPRDALISASIDERIRGKAYGFHRAMDHAGAVIGPLLAILVLSLLILVFEMRESLLILRWTFVLAIIPGMFALLTLIFFVREKGVVSSASRKIKLSLRQFDKHYLIYLGIVTLFTLGNSADAFLLFRAQESLNNSDTLYTFIYTIPLINDIMARFTDPQTQKQMIDIMFIPLLWAFFHIIKVIFSTYLGALSDRLGRKKVIIAGWIIYACVYLAFAFLDQLPYDQQLALTFILFAIYALYYAFCEGAEKAFVADFVKPELHGSAFGLYNFSIGTAALPASIIFGLIYSSYGAGPAFALGAALAFISILLLIFFVKSPGEKPRL